MRGRNWERKGGAGMGCCESSTKMSKIFVWD